MASITVSEARMAVIKPYDPSQLDAIEKAIRDSDLGVNPTNDGMIIRVVFPQLTEERRRELGKVARHKGEEAKVSIRNVRRHAKDALDKMAQDGEAGEDEVRRAEKELDETTAQVRRTPSTRWSSTRKPSCSRSERARPDGHRSDGGRPGQRRRRQRGGDGVDGVAAPPARPGRNLPAAIGGRRSGSVRS